MASLRTLFATQIYEASLAEARDFEAFNAALRNACLMLADDDHAGRAWCKKQGYGGYTSYASLDDLPVRDPAFADLKKRLDKHAAAFAEALALDLGPRGRLKLDSLWVNVLKPGSGHSGHIHPHSVLSGTVYVALPAGAAGLKLEDPRLAMQMAAPPRRADAPEVLKSFVTLTPAVGTVLMWESWLRHEVPPTGGKGPRISVSFNYAWK
jgi:uncharacterized protein (TIGR02466 family)